MLPERDHIRIIWGGTVEEPWPNYLARGCPKCGQMPVFLKAVPELPLIPSPTAPNRLHGREQVRVRLDEHTIPHRVVGRTRKFA